MKFSVRILFLACAALRLPVYPGIAEQIWRMLLSSLFPTVTWETDVWWILCVSRQTAQAIPTHSTPLLSPTSQCKELNSANKGLLWSEPDLLSGSFESCNIRDRTLQGPQLWHLHSYQTSILTFCHLPHIHFLPSKWQINQCNLQGQ